MKFPALFVNHGGGPMPLLGKQPELTAHMKQVVKKWLPPEPPKSIVVFSAHWESDPIRITSSPNPSMYYDYYGFPSETYEYEYSAPGSPELANKIQELLRSEGLNCELDGERGFDHGVFVPLMLMYPEANIPVVSVSLHSSLSAESNMAIGRALEPLREEGVLLLGSGYTFHNLKAFFNPSQDSINASFDFNQWLKTTLLQDGDTLSKLVDWKSAPGATICHPREEHLLPLFIVAASGGSPKLIYDSTVPVETSDHGVTGYVFK